MTALPILATALAALERGWSVLPVIERGGDAKKPHRSLIATGHHKPGKRPGTLAPSWSSLQCKRPTPEDLHVWFSGGGRGVALVTGQVSSVIVLDFDGEAGVALMRRLNLHPHVRTGSGGYHVYFQHPGWPVKTLNSKSKQALGERWPGLDIRADGGYAVMPPSRNDSGPYEALRDLSDLEPLDKLPEDLRDFLGLLNPPVTHRSTAPEQIRQVDEDALLRGALREAQASGRNNGGFWLACQLRDNGYGEGEAHTVGGRYVAQVTGSNMKGEPEPYTLADFEASVGQAYRTPAREPWQAGAKSKQVKGAIVPSLPEIVTNGRQLRDLAADAQRVLLAANHPPTLFQRGGELVRVSQEEDETRLKALDRVALNGVLARIADFVTVKEDIKPARPPADLAPDLLARVEHLELPPLRTLAKSPIYGRGGKLLSREGYDTDSGIYLALRGLTVPALPSLPDALALLSELLTDFPFAPYEAGYAHTLAALLLPFVRPMIDGPTPLHLIEAPTRGSGKGLLSEVVAHVTLGGAAGVMVQPRDGDEFEKRVTSTLLEGARVVLLDNVHSLKGEALAAILTARTWRGRRLGKSEMLTLNNDALWLATGNNVSLDDDMPRRIIPIRLDPGVERPEERTGFKHPDLLGWVKVHRPALVAACLALVEAWKAQGCPRGTARLGSYESWTAVIGGILEVAGVPGFLTGREGLYETANAEPQEWAEVLATLYRKHGREPITACEFLAAMRATGTLLDLWEGKRDLNAQQRIGHAVKARRDRVFGGLMIRLEGKQGGSFRYRVEPSGQGGLKTPKTTETPSDPSSVPSDSEFQKG